MLNDRRYGVMDVRSYGRRILATFSTWEAARMWRADHPDRCYLVISDLGVCDVE